MDVKRKYFGTDGIRGLVGEGVITPEFMLKLGWAIGKILGNGGGNKVLIGKDTRISGYLFESALQAGLAAAGMNIHLLGPLPTPAIAYLTRQLQAQAGIVISASHNPHYDNGIKLFSAQGYKLSDEIELAIEAQLDLPLSMVKSEQLGKASRVTNAIEQYADHCCHSVGDKLNLAGLTIVVDCANGASYQVAPLILEKLGAKVIPLANMPDGININQNCGSTQPQFLQQMVRSYNADLGIAFDGDADRVLMVDNQGELVDGDELIYIIAKHMLTEEAGLGGGVVGTLMSNLGLELALKALQVPFLRANVGDRYVMDLLQKNQWLLGGEPSGHIIHLGVTTTGDGIVSALQVLAALQASELSLHELKQGMHKMPQMILNISIDRKITNPTKNPTIKHAVKEAQSILGDRGRIVLRPSGTEPLIRVMVEGEEAVQVERVARELAQHVEHALLTAV